MILPLRRALPAAASAFVLLAACGAGAGSPPEDARCAALQKKLGAALDSAVAARGITGAAAAVDVDGCSFRGASGLAVPGTATALAAGDLFRIGSITKTFVSTLILMLQAEGRLSLDDRVSAHVAGVPGAEHISVRQLLNHTSGLYNYTDSQAFWEACEAGPGRAFTPAELIAFAAAHPPYFPPGGGFHYANTNYIVAGLIAEAVGGEPLERQLRRRIFEPLGMSHTYLDGAEPARPGLVSGFAPSADGYEDETHAGSPSGAWAAGALVSSTDDVNRFLARLLGGNLLAPAQLAEMTTWTRTPFPQAPEYGLGISEHDTALGMSLGHVGSIAGYDAWTARVGGRGVTITVLANQVEAGAMVIADRLAAALE
jgi:D-alanyl-D-alanine carboxypeptidase